MGFRKNSAGSLHVYGALPQDHAATGALVGGAAIGVGLELLLGALFGGVAGAILPNTGFAKGATVGLVSTGLAAVAVFALTGANAALKKA